MKKLVQKILKSSALGRLAYEPLHKLYRLYSVPHRRRMLQKHGADALAGLAEIFKRRRIPAYALYGTLLGFVRDAGFIKHDDDMDLGVMPGEWTAQRLLHTLLEEESGFSYLFGFVYDNRMTEFKLCYRNVPIDFFFFTDDGKHYFSDNPFYLPEVNYPDPNANSVRRLPEIRITELTTLRVCGVDFPVPANYEDAIIDHYGAQWRTPDKGGDYKKELYAKLIDMPGYAMSVTKEKALAM